MTVFLNSVVNFCCCLYLYLPYVMSVSLTFFVIDVCSHHNMQNISINIQCWLFFPFSIHGLVNQMFIINRDTLTKHFVDSLPCEWLHWGQEIGWDSLSSARLRTDLLWSANTSTRTRALYSGLTNAFWTGFVHCVCKWCLNLRCESNKCKRGPVQLFYK